ncbi:hypothetical protein [Streptomyces sp. H27-D2]|uniref:hypothetical protein n=1 Tax=Streptomyces sp. H27-D2 TaxID=3046304 RepID=UPI002DBF9F07|nr:hypothetical protein [Streptomyces sp. H27-D2]MEC4019798.1 hypothetical protein [Streptomyces sp. H27-D2]
MLDAHRGRTLGDWGILIGIYSTLTLGILGILLNFRVISVSEEANKTAKEGNKIAEEDGKPKAELELAKVTAGIKEGISGTSTDGPASPVKVDGLRGVHIEVTVRNLENAPSFISKATMTFRKSGHLEACYGLGGPLVYTADYKFTIPDEQPVSGDGRSYKVPFSLSAELTHQIPPNRYEKFMLTVGPERSPEGSSPWYGVLDVTLEHDDGKKLKVGPLAVIDTGDNSMFYPDGKGWHVEAEHIAGCTKRNAALVAEVMRTPKLTASKEFASLDRALRGRFAP